MKTILIEETVIQIQFDLLLQNKQIEDLREEIRLLRIEVQLNQRKPPSVLPLNTTKIGYRTFNPDRVKEVMKQSKLNKKFKT